MTSFSRFATGALIAAVTMTSAVVLGSFTGCSGGDTPGRTIVLAIDGIDPGVIDLLMSEGKMENFAKLRQEGAYGHLISSRPILSPIIWTTVATGREPSDHGIGHFVAINETSGEQLPVTSQMRKVKAVWDLQSTAGRDVAVVGWWATWPAETVNGNIVSDHTCYHFLFEDGRTGRGEAAGVTYPEGLFAEIEPMVRRPGDVTYQQAAPFVTVTPEEFARDFAFDDDLGHFKWALATARSYESIGLHLWETRKPDLLMVYIEGVDSSSHLFGHLFRAEGLAGELLEQQKKFGRTVEQMYLEADRILGRYLEAMDDDTTLVVLSDHGFELGVLHDDPSKTRDMRRVSERYHKIEGTLYMYGRGIRGYGRLNQPKLVDITPTLLALAGMRPARDMPGRVLTEALDFEPPSDRVPTYETGGPRAASGADAAAPVDPAILDHLRALGYLDTESPTGDRNLAAMHFQAGRYEEAAKTYRRLLAEKPEDGALRTSLAGTLAALGDYEAALVELAESERTSPLNPEIYHNRGAIFERQGKRTEAVAEYARAVRYSPQYEPSRLALQRLTGSAEPNAPSTDAERLAYTLAQRAGDAAKRTDYAKANGLLDEAERVAPGYGLLFQYRSNVAFLAGDIEGAIRALERAIAIEPDNALFRANLDHLEKRAAGDAGSAAEPPSP